VTDAALHRTEYGAHGTRVVFLHGLFGQGRNWTQFGKALADRHRVELIDLPDHGRSAWTAGFDQVEVADTIAAALAQGDDPVALIGHSLGGKVAMALALRHPALVERLCVVDVAPVGYERSREFAGYIEAMKRIDLDALTRREDAEAALLEAVPSATVRAFLLQNLRREGDGWRWQANLDGIDRSLTAISSWPADELASAPPYGGPVLWIGGARSDYITEAAVPVMDRLFPHNRRVTIKNAGHWVHSEQPEVFAEVLRRFLG
jgi:pimeloyl-ACP methyl ester carboxylesterase